ncbi:MAG: patatin-like phospholipase family protein [Pseudomonadota bacterium]
MRGNSLRLHHVLLALALPIQLAACASNDRLPALPIADAPAARVLDIPNARFYASGDSARIAAFAESALLKRSRSGTRAREFSFLAISGGGENGAFGAGLLAGWSERGTRPKFDVVTGISTGALSAPFAFLGPAYDRRMRDVYTSINADDIFQKHSPILATLTNEALTDTTPLRELILEQMSADFVRRIAEEYSKGRLLLILTTNLDQGRAVIWNIGAIAESAHSKARELIVDILLASAAIPGVFPPVMLDVTANGKRYQEMHVDGGLIAQAFLYPPSYSPSHLRDKRLRHRLPKRRVAYIIRNGRVKRAEAEVKRKTLDISKHAISTMIASSGVNDTYRIFVTTERDDIKFRLAHIKNDFDVVSPGPFDREYMNALYQYGYRLGRRGYHWRDRPLDFSN